jgi:dephospho-CoA kinase
MLRIALTGGIACGKSVAAGMIADMGLCTIEADEIAREVMQPGTEVYRDVKRCFGSAALDAEGKIDRKALGRVVMNDAEKRKELNAIVHPHVISRWREWLETRPDNTRAAVVVVPLLYEAGQGDGWDAVICLHAGRSEQVARLEQRGIAPEEAAKWLAAQMKLSEKAKLADYVICNNGSLKELREQIDMVINRILER